MGGVAVGTDGDDVVAARELADDGDEGTAGMVAGEEVVADLAGPDGREVEVGLALPVAEGAGHGGTVGYGLQAHYLVVGMSVVPLHRVDMMTCHGDMG